jgi:hypothetical protein
VLFRIPQRFIEASTEAKDRRNSSGTNGVPEGLSIGIQQSCWRSSIRQALRKAMQKLPVIRRDDAESSQSGTMNNDFILPPESVRKA